MGLLRLQAYISGNDTTMTKHTGMTLRIGAAYDELHVNIGGREATYDRSGMTGFQKKALLKDVKHVRAQYGNLAVA